MKFFNKLVFSILIFSLVFNTSCKDDDGGTDLSTAIIGDWVISNISATVGGISINGNTADFVTPTCAADDVLQFNADNTLTISDGVEVCEDNTSALIEGGTWSVTGNQLSVSSGGESLSFAFSIEGNTMTWTFSGSALLLLGLDLNLNPEDSFTFTLTKQ